MLEGFKNFILRGNVIDLAVGVVIGAAFTAVVTAFSDNIINPLIASVGGADYSGLGFHIISGNDATFLDFGALITAAINFLLIAAVVYFVIVAPMNKLDEMQKHKRGIQPDAPAPTETELLTEIRDLLSEKPAQQ
ncbi:mechanosensitive ion channel protein MscL [Corynebacterium sp. NML98-0116]|uniref:Large-conductance mechanosensitive channel n=2 Tax=Corynebacterium TaxID=1716 RepID=A0ABD4TQR1_9CORY|nr:MULTISPECIES: large-conductance mechanosensitive channel protein MscL [Corynebacterium]AOX05959.1 mechanosensitive ion channel protein MscL [Corynebacterium sp. NML98-0116]MCO6394219.1 large-conductance mechanosensitive channel protein MscL [Corynebacterium lipophilum]MCQ4607257.1 large-conductance mechanosensitive channel protein MscL [Corynebacterium pseudogenitalium]MCQ4609264.1 large-conductance mechanosensitive channel protein MscL [Corynebacterium sp. CCUG 61414]MCQ4612889.1 large-con